MADSVGTRGVREHGQGAAGRYGAGSRLRAPCAAMSQWSLHVSSATRRPTMREQSGGRVSITHEPTSSI